MSVALLQDPTRGNELADDRESCLYVLIWMALCYTTHTITLRNLDAFLRPFSEVDEDDNGAMGGDLKMCSLLFGNIPRWVKFDDRPHLDALIAELTKMFAVRYLQPIINIPSEVARFEEINNNMKRDGWLVETFRRHLNAGPWPTSDGAVLPGNNGGETDGETDGPPPAKRMKSSEVCSGLHGGSRA